LKRLKEAKKYAKVLLDTVGIEKAPQAIAELSTINDLMVRNKDFKSLLVNPQFSLEEREKIIKQISGIGRVSMVKEGFVEVESAPGKDIRPVIARNVIKAGFDLLELKSIDLSLEDIFIQLTREEPEPPSTDDSEERS